MALLYGHAIKVKGLDADHTYVTSNDGGKWGCWGRDSGGKAICFAVGSSKRANCLSQSSSHAGIIYGLTGVCHQTANRILFPARIAVSAARGYWVSVTLYGTYGTLSLPSLIEWEVRKSRCKKVRGDFGFEKWVSGIKTVAKTAKTAKKAAPVPGLSSYLKKVNAAYVKKAGPMKVQALSAAKKVDLLGKELELMVDHRLGAVRDPRRIKALRKYQSGLILKKDALDGALIGRGVTADNYAEQVNDLLGKFLKQSAAHLGSEQFTTLFGMPHDAGFRLVDPRILAKYHRA